jgi:putative transposase
MPRNPRNYSPEIAYHIIVRGNNRQPLFRKQEDFEKYLFFLRFLKSKFPFDLYDYCLMTNHIHLLMLSYLYIGSPGFGEYDRNANEGDRY